MARKSPLSVRVRMYRQGLGDCFLLTFKRGRKVFNMMIDCGLIQQTPDETNIMQNVVKDIAAAVKNKLDVVAVTHEHWDHISGFEQAKDVFDLISFDEVWVGWTEDKNHPQAQAVQEHFKKQLTGVRAALDKIKSPELQGFKQSVSYLVHDFFADDVLGADKGGRSAAWEYVLNKPNSECKFCSPGKVLTFKDFDGIRIYVLGPPEDFKIFSKTDPTKAESYKNSGLTSADSFFSAAAAESDFFDAEAFLPFENSLQISKETAQSDEFFRQHYGFGNTDKWRRIDEDWLTIVGELALNIDSYTNNTCLALAIEFVESGKVLLFPGDAQYGNWISWKDLTWEITDQNGDKKTVTTADLLNKTVFYKVGHHGSHNATMRENGLEKMNSPDLTAMIPVDRAMAKKRRPPTTGWKMPFQELFTHLQERAQGRVIIADESDTAELKNRCLDKTSPTQTDKFLKKVNVQPLFVEFMIEDKIA